MLIHPDGEEHLEEQMVDSLTLKKRPFTIVGMGGSAGAFTAVQEFLKEIPEKSGIAFVLVQHLDPTHPSILAELLQRSTSMPVLRVEDGAEVKPDHVYVIPENKEMAILNGNLLLMEPIKPRGQRMPIDSFLQSLAADWGESAVCAIFSGMGSDGETGARFIKEGLGLVMVQAPESAQYESMPRSIIESDNPDYVESPQAMARKLLDYVKAPIHWTDKTANLSRKDITALQKTFVLLRSQMGHDFSLYKKNTLIRRMERRMHMHQLPSQEEYVRYLQQTPKEVEALFKELLIGVTKFFRDFPAFEILESKVIASLLKEKKPNDSLRIWVAGCSTGEEAYSMAILVQECLDKLKLKHRLKIQIFATDLDPDAIRKARLGKYLQNISNDISQERLERWFILKDNSYQVNQEIREMIVFAEHNLIRDASFTHLDLLCCRNVLIYFTPELQKKLLPLFHYTLRTNGILFLGPSETLGDLDEMFAAVDSRWKIFKKREFTAPLTRFIEFPVQTIPTHRLHLSQPVESQTLKNWNRNPTLAERIGQILLERHTPPAIVINTKGEAIYIHGRTGKYLEPAPGQLNVSIYDMAREGLVMELRGAVLKAIAQKEKVVVERVNVKTNGHHQLTKITVEPINDANELKDLLLITLEEQPGPAKKRARGKSLPAAQTDQRTEQLENDLALTRTHLQETIEQMQTTVEELKSANEELQSTNEELQSTNEESNTAKEEMQALNEELMTVNMEFRSKTEQLTQLNNDVANLLNSSEVATVFLNNNLSIKWFTPSVSHIVPLVQSDVGRPITHFSSTLKYEHLAQDVKEVLEKLASKDVILESVTGHWYQLRIVPYRTLDNFIGGVVLTFVDISHLKRLQTHLEETVAFVESILDTARDPMLVLDTNLQVISINQAFVSTFRVDKSQIQGQLFYFLGNGQWDIPELREKLYAVLVHNQEMNEYWVEHTFPSIGYRRMKLHARRLVNGLQSNPRILLTIEDVK